MQTEKRLPGTSVRRTLIRWIGNPLQRKYEWQFSRHYWTLVSRWRSARFWLGRRFFNANSWLRSQRDSASILHEILKTIIKEIVLAVLLVVILALLEIAVSSNLPALLSYLRSTLSWLGLDRSTYGNYLAVLAQIAGVFLGLYFTAVSVVASKVYSGVPSDVRSLLMHEKFGSYYIRIVALLGTICILLLMSASMGFLPGVLHLLLITFLAIVAILGFVILGLRAFNFFDPSHLTGYLADELITSIRSATPLGFQWQDPLFQASYQKQADELLTTYRDVVHVAATDEHPQPRALMGLGLGALNLLVSYSKQKGKIPSDSYWFRRTYQHRDWLTTDYAWLNFALSTGTSLQPEIVPDLNWVESEIEGIVSSIMRTLVGHPSDIFDEERLRSAVVLCNGVQNTLSILSEHFAVKESLHLFHTLWPLVFSQAQRLTLNATDTQQDNIQTLLSLGLVDTYSVGLTRIMLSFSKSVSSGSDSFRETVNRVRWEKRKSLYVENLPRALTEQLEYLLKGLQFEHEIEGHKISPVWYRQQLAAAGFSRFVSETLDSMLGEIQNTFVNSAQTAIASKQFVLAAEVIERGIEASEKCKAHLDDMRIYLDRLSTFQRVTDMPWPLTDWKKLGEQSNLVRRHLVVSLGRSAPALSQMPPSKYLPDYFGHAYSLLAEECYRAMATGDEALFSEIFRQFFLIWQPASERLRIQMLALGDPSLFALSAEPLLDILELSGYALVYSELDGRTYWEAAKGLWDRYFAKAPNPKDTLKFMIEFLGYRQSVFAIFPRDVVRTKWEQDLENRLRERGLIDEYGQTRTIHASAIIRVVARSGHLFLHGAMNIFVAEYLRRLPEAAGLEFPHDVESVADTIKRERLPGSSGQKSRGKAKART